VMSEESAFPASKITVRTAVAPASTFAAIRAAVRRVDAEQLVANLQPLPDVIAAPESGRSFDVSLVSAFSLLALVLATVGIYGLFAQVAERTGEIGSSGAGRDEGIGDSVGDAKRVAVGDGVPTGIAAAVAASRLLA